MGLRKSIRKAKAQHNSKRILKSNKRAVQKKKAIPNDEQWETLKSTNINYEHLGLARNLNEQVGLLKNVKTTKLPLEVDYEVDAKGIQALNQVKQPWNSDNPKLRSLLKANITESVKEGKKKPKINKDEKMTLEKLMKRYHLDFEAMRRDVKINVFQWTETQCLNKIKAYGKKFSDEISKYITAEELETLDDRVDKTFN